MSYWCPYCNNYHDSTTSVCPYLSVNANVPINIPKIFCPRCGQEIKVEVKK